MDNRQQIAELNPELFTYSNYVSDWWSLLELNYAETFSNDILARKIKSRCIGYCDASRLRVRPRDDLYAVMCEDSDYEKFWFHVPKKFFEEKVMN